MREIKFRAVTREGYVIQDIGKIEFFEDGTIIVNDEFPVKELIQSEVKEPWEMTRREFNQGIMPKRIKQRTAFHKKLIQEALSEGKPVPPEVLKDYRGKMTIKPTETIKCRGMKFRKKPVMIEAVRFPEDGILTMEFIDFLNVSPRMALPGEEYNNWGLKTLNGFVTVERGDWIIKGVKGEFNPCKPDIFEQTYEKAD